MLCYKNNDFLTFLSFLVFSSLPPYREYSKGLAHSRRALFPDLYLWPHFEELLKAFGMCPHNTNS